MKEISIFTLILFVLFGKVYGQNNITSTIKLNAETGEVISGLPTSLAPSDELNFQLYFSPSYKAKEVTKLLDHHFTAYKKIKKLVSSNENGILLLKDEDGIVRDYVYYKKEGYKNDKGNKASFTRIPHHKGFQIHPEINGESSSPGKQVIPKSIVISELILDPISASIDSNGDGETDNNDQMIELLNLRNTGASIPIGNWEILVNGEVVKQIPSGTNLEPVEAKSFFKNFGFSRYNSTVTITLRDNKKIILDEVSINLPVNKSYINKVSLSRTYKKGSLIFDKHNSAGSSEGSFSKDKPSLQNLTGPLMPDDVLINEVYIDDDNSFVEISNYSDKTIDLKNWKLYNGSTPLHTFGSTKLKPGKIITVLDENAPGAGINANPPGLSFGESLFKESDLKSLKTRIEDEVNRIMADKSRFIQENKTDWIFDWHKYDRKRDEFEFNNRVPNKTYTLSQVPDYLKDFSKEYELRLVYFDSKGQIVHEEVQKLSPVDLFDFPNPEMIGDKPEKLLKNFNAVSVSDLGAKELLYELRLLNPYFNYINKKHKGQVRKQSYDLLSKKPLELVAKKYSQISKDRSGNNAIGFADYDKEQIEIAINRDVKLYELMVHSIPNLNSWLLDWLWFNKGELRLNPLNTAINQSNLTKLNQEIKELKIIIAKSDSVYNLQKLEKNDSKLFKNPIELEKKTKSQAMLQKSISDVKELQLRDKLLYKGKMFLSNDKKNITSLMRHHDAKHNYTTWAESDTKEVTENQRLHVLIENEKPSTSTLLTITETPIENEESILEDETAQTPKNSDLDLSTLNSRKAFFESELTYALPISSNRDITPGIQTTKVIYEFPVSAPANVSYTLKVGSKGNEKDVSTGKYRNNKLHRVRFKSGLLYSTLRLQGIDSTGSSPTRRSYDFGVDGTFGFQIYFNRTDSRKIGLEFRNNRPTAAFFYLGFSMKNIQDNLYTGFGLEPISGVSFMGGLHVGQRNKVNQVDNEVAIVGEEWTTGIFGSVVIDINVLTKLFGLSTTIPFQ